MPNSSKPPLRNPRSKRPTRAVHIVGTGSYVPDRVLTNADLEKMVDTTDDWIVSRSGIKERRIAPLLPTLGENGRFADAQHARSERTPNVEEQ